ncbi:MAG TPA: TolC family protein [Ignavibacteria bacterium]|nr:TolC family protein [Ignavibacteria bacterium]
MFNKILIIIFISCGILNSQNGFDSYLAKDSTYRFNSSLRVLDSLLKNKSFEWKTDTSFSNSFGKAETITLSQLMFAAVSNNPDLKTIQLDIESKTKEAEQKAYLPDPMFETELDDIMSDFKRIGMINFFVSQMFMFPGKLSLERESVLRAKRMLESEKLDMAVRMMNMVRMNYYNLYLVEKRLLFNNENQLIIKTFLSAAEAKYSVGKGMQQEVFKAQIEYSRLTNEEFLLKQEKKNIFSELARITKLVLDENTRISFNNIDPEYLLERSNFDFNERNTESLIYHAFEYRADVKTLQNKILMKQTDLEMAKISRLPDLTLKAGYKILPFEEKNAFTFMFGINIPIAPWTSGKYDYSIQKSEINIKTTRQELESKKNEIRNEITTIVNNIKSTKETMNYYYGVMIPQTENTLKSTQYNYETGMTGILDLLDSYKMYQEAWIMYYESVSMYLKMIGELENAAGLNLKK